MFNKAQLIERGSHYFDDPKISKMYATTYGNFFHDNAKNYADSHAKGLKTHVIEITRGEMIEKEENPKEENPKTEEKKVEAPVESNDLSIEELRAEGKRLKIPKYWVIKEKTLKKKIAEANGST